jgi:Flp pilus assembly protein TadB
MATPRTPEPHEPRPLSNREQRALSDLEQRLAHDDPTLSLSMRAEPPRLRTLSPRAYNAVIQVAVVVVVLVVVLPSPWAATLIAIVFMTIPTALVVHAARRERRERESRGT